MAKIDEMDGRRDGAYTRLFGDEKLGHLISQTHAASIRAGNELEKALREAIPPGTITTLADIARGMISEDREVVIKPSKPRAGDELGIVADFAVFFHSKQRFFVVELKDGDVFDTQKAPAARLSLQSITKYLRDRTGFTGDFFVCSFNALSKESIVAGFKNNFAPDEVMTGAELCFYLGVDYEEILAQRQEDQEHNKYYLLNQISKIKTDMTPAEYFEEKHRRDVEQLRWHWGQ